MSKSVVRCLNCGEKFKAGVSRCPHCSQNQESSPEKAPGETSGNWLGVSAEEMRARLRQQRAA